MNKKNIGIWGESLAKQYLKNKGYQILETNWRYRHKELDMIAYKNGTIGIEVKTRKNRDTPSFSILKAKQVNNLRLAIKAYCHLRHLDYEQSRLDLLIIEKKDQNTIFLRHYRGL